MLTSQNIPVPGCFLAPLLELGGRSAKNCILPNSTPFHLCWRAFDWVYGNNQKSNSKVAEKKDEQKKDKPQKSGLKRKENVVTSNLKKVKKAWIYF